MLDKNKGGVDLEKFANIEKHVRASGKISVMSWIEYVLFDNCFRMLAKTLFSSTWFASHYYSLYQLR